MHVLSFFCRSDDLFGAWCDTVFSECAVRQVVKTPELYEKLPFEDQGQIMET